MIVSTDLKVISVSIMVVYIFIGLHMVQTVLKYASNGLAITSPTSNVNICLEIRLISPNITINPESYRVISKRLRTLTMSPTQYNIYILCLILHIPGVKNIVSDGIVYFFHGNLTITAYRTQCVIND